MERESFSNDQADGVLSHRFSGPAVFYAEICEWLIDADRGQRFLADGARNLPEWVSARFGLRHATAAQLVRVARRLVDLPVLRSRFAAGELCLDQVDAISRLATPDTEEAVIAERLACRMPPWIVPLAVRTPVDPMMRSSPGGNAGCGSNTPWTGSGPG